MPVQDASPPDTAEIGRPRVEVRLLGPFEAAVAGRAIHIGSPKQRAVLAALALDAGKLVTSSTLCDLVWGHDQPASSSATLQSLISRLRSTLSDASGGVADSGREVLRTREPGWILDIDQVAVDALRFQALTARARTRGAHEANAVARDLTEAVGLWRGSALVDVVEAGYLAPQSTRLNEARLDAIEDLAEAELATGHPADALARLEAHVEANPLRERGWSQLMVALYRLGRQAAALRAFGQVRTILAEELGLEPSPELREIERRILHHDPALSSPSPSWFDRKSMRRPSAAPRSPAAEREGAPPRPPTVGIPAPGPAGEFADYSVVVVEDHDFQRRTVVQLLRKLGVGRVADAPNGVEALQILKSGPVPDIIVCDIDMPGMDGIEFVASVAENNLACSIVIASGLDAKVLRAVESIGESHGLHVLAALEKPLTARRLGDVLRQYTRVNRERTNQLDSTPIGGEDLRAAMHSGEMTARFEPRVDLTAGAVSGAEAGGRWLRPDGTHVAPPRFIPALTREGLLLAYVERLIEESCVLLDEVGATDLGADAPFRVAVNVSLLPMADASPADHIIRMVEGRGHDPRRFVCEVDDLALARAPGTGLQVLTRLRVKGFGLSIVNTGAGPSWTHQLDRVPVSELKLDRRLVSGATGDSKRLEMLESALASARDLKLAVVADGCDSQDDFDTLLALGCAEAQGRFVAEPMAAADFVSWALTGGRLGGLGFPA